MRRALVGIVTVGVLTIGLATTSLSAAPPAGAALRRTKMLAWVNHARIDHHVHSVQMVRSVVRLAHDHNLAMARERRLFHTSDLGDRLRFVS